MNSNDHNEFVYVETKSKITDSWLPKQARKITIAILNKIPDEGKSINQKNIFGTSFLINFHRKIYLITAKHVLKKLKDAPPFLVFSYIDKITNQPSVFTLKGKDLTNHSLEWIYPEKEHEDYAFLHLCQKELDLLTAQAVQVDFSSYKIEKDKGNWLKIKDRVGENTAALGYPNQGTSIYKDGTRSFFAQSMISELTGLNLRTGKIVLRVKTTDPNEKTVSMEIKPGGLSGGPIFIRNLENKNGLFSLIGMVTEVLPSEDDSGFPFLNYIGGITITKILALINEKQTACACDMN